MVTTYHLQQKENIVPFGYKIKAAGMFDFEELYQELQRWVVYYNYKWQETKYRHVENPDGSKHVEIMWECPKKIDDYVTFKIILNLQVFHSDVEANVEGVKRKLNKGSYEFRFHAFYEKNWDVWKGTLGELKKQIYERLIIRKRLEAHEVVMYNEVHMLFDEIKAYMKLYGSS